MTSESVYYGRTMPADRGRYVTKTWHKPPGLCRDWRGWAVMEGSEEISLHVRCTDAYLALDAKRADS